MMNVSLDAETGVSEVEDLCVVLTADTLSDALDFNHKNNKFRRVWITHNRTRLTTGFGRKMTISDIPHMPEISDQDLCGVLEDPLWMDPDTGIAHTKPLSAFKHIHLKVERWKDEVFNAAAAISVNTQIRDDVILSSDVSGHEPKLIPWATVGELRKQRFEVRKRLRFLITRNTSPLIMGTAFVKATESLHFRHIPYINAADVQYFYDQKIGKNNFSDQDLFLGGGMNPHIFHSRSHDKHHCWQLNNLKKFILSEMHPSAHDPKFRDRFEEWVADWPASREHAYRWIRTWSGRLRRLQARRYRQEHSLISRIDALIVSHESAVVDLQNSFKFDVMTSFLQTSHVLSYALSPFLNMDTKDLHAHVRASLSRIAPYFNTGECDKRNPEIMIRIQAAGRVLGNPERPEAPCIETPNKMMLIAQLPEPWRAGVDHSLKAVRAGKKMLYDVLADPFEQPQGNEQSVWEFVRENPHVYRGDKKTWRKPIAFPVYAGMEGMTPQDGGARLAFVRGKVAAWNILTSDETKVQLTLDEVITLVMNQVLF